MEYREFIEKLSAYNKIMSLERIKMSPDDIKKSEIYLIIRGKKKNNRCD